MVWTGFSERWIEPYLTVVITLELSVLPDATFQRNGQLYDHIFCPLVISSGVFTRNWAMCKIVWVESQFFLRNRWIRFLGFLLIPNYNHDKIIREFRRPRRRTEILCFECRRIRLDCGREVNRVGLCLFANNSMINHAKTRMIDQIRSPLLFTLLTRCAKVKTKWAYWGFAEIYNHSFWWPCACDI